MTSFWISWNLRIMSWLNWWLQSISGDADFFPASQPRWRFEPVSSKDRSDGGPLSQGVELWFGRGKPWLGDRREHWVLWGATPSYDMSREEKHGNTVDNTYQPRNRGGVPWVSPDIFRYPWYFQVPKLFGLLSCCQSLGESGKNSPKILKMAVFKTELGKRWLWATPWPDSQ